MKYKYSESTEAPAHPDFLFQASVHKNPLVVNTYSKGNTLFSIIGSYYYFPNFAISFYFEIISTKLEITYSISSSESFVCNGNVISLQY